MTPLRNKMIRELQLQRKAPATIHQYVHAVADLARHYGRRPDKISLEEVRSYLHYLLVERKLAANTCNLKVVALRFFYRKVLGQQDFELNVRCKRSGKLPEPLSREEVARLFEATNNLKHRLLLMTTYAAGPLSFCAPVTSSTPPRPSSRLSGPASAPRLPPPTFPWQDPPPSTGSHGQPRIRFLNTICNSPAHPACRSAAQFNPVLSIVAAPRSIKRSTLL